MLGVACLLVGTTGQFASLLICYTCLLVGSTRECRTILLDCLFIASVAWIDKRIRKNEFEIRGSSYLLPMDDLLITVPMTADVFSPMACSEAVTAG